MSEGVPSPVRVLVADTDLDSRKKLNQYFDREGWSYDSVGDSESLLAALKERKYDLVVTDLCMPDIEGVELLRKIKQERPSQPVVVVADSSLERQANEFLQSGSALDFLPRPLVGNMLGQVLKRIARAITSHGDGKKGKRESVFELPYAKSYKFTSREYDENKLKLPILEFLIGSSKIELNTALKLDLAYQEAVTNALEHGNLELESVWKEEVDDDGRDRYSRIKEQRLQDSAYADRFISIEVRCDEKSLRICIKDDGKGFPAEADAPKSSDLTDTIHCHGRGLTIMHSVMDAVSYSEEGTVVTMEKYFE